jgi:hypothetical protein
MVGNPLIRSARVKVYFSAMKRGLTGHYLPLPSAGGEAARAFVPNPLPPEPPLEALKGGRNGQHSIRVNDQWRVCFRWQGSDAHGVEIVDYH